MTRQRVALVAVLAGLLVLLAASSAVAPTAGQTAPNGTNTTNAGYTLAELGQASGQYADNPAAAPPSVRVLDADSGAVALRYKPAKPMQSSSWQFLEDGTRIETNTIQVYSTVFEPSGNYELEVVSYRRGTQRTQTDNGVVRERVPVNVSTKETGVQVGPYYTSNVSLPSHFDQEYRMTVFLLRNGERVAAWQFSHQSNPLMRGTAINSTGDAIGFGLLNFFLPAIVAIPIARRRAKSDLEDIVVGPMRGMLWWFMVVVVGLFTTGTVLFYQTAVLLTALPWLAGLTIAAAVYIGYIQFRDEETEDVEIDQRDVEHVRDPQGEDERPMALHATKTIRKGYRRDNKLYLPQPGIPATLARKWADPAYIDMADVTTVVESDGDVDLELQADPQSEHAIDVTPAHLTLDVPLTRELDEPPEDPTFWDQMTRSVSRLNWPFLVKSAIGFAVINSLFATVGLTGLGTALGLVPALAMSLRAVDGEVAWEPAPMHMADARDLRKRDFEEYVVARTFDDLLDEVANNELVGVEEGKRMVEQVMGTLRENLNEITGMDHSRNGHDDPENDGEGQTHGGDIAVPSEAGGRDD